MPAIRSIISFEVKTQEDRAVFAHAVSSEPWLEVGRRTFAGRSVALPLLVRAIPNRPGETLRAHVRVTANGNQKFDVPVTLTVGTKTRTHDDIVVVNERQPSLPSRQRGEGGGWR